MRQAEQGERQPQHGGWELTWSRLRATISDGVERALAQADPEARARVLEQALAEAERLARVAHEQALARALAGDDPEPERRRAERAAAELAEHVRRSEHLRAQLAADLGLAPAARRLQAALEQLGAAADAAVVQRLREELEHAGEHGDGLAGELRECARLEAEIQASLRAASDAVTEAEVAAQRLRDQAAEASSCRASASGSSASRRAACAGQASGRADARDDEQAGNEEPLQPLAPEEAEALRARVQRLERRREQLGPVNPLAQQEYAEALAHVAGARVPARRSRDGAARAQRRDQGRGSPDQRDLRADVRDGGAQLRGAGGRPVPRRQRPSAARPRRAGAAAGTRRSDRPPPTPRLQDAAESPQDSEDAAEAEADEATSASARARKRTRSASRSS